MSHLDMMRAFSRAVFASDLPIWFTEGFHPHPHIVFGQPLPLGMAGKNEFADLKSDSEIPPEIIIERLNRFLPDGIKVVSAGEPVYKPKEIMTASFTTETDISYADKFESMWDKESIIVYKKSKRGLKEIDLKKEIISLEIKKEDKLIINTLMPCTVDGAVTPAQLVSAFNEYTGEEIFTRHSRNGFYLEDMTPFK